MTSGLSATFPIIIRQTLKNDDVRFSSHNSVEKSASMVYDGSEVTCMADIQPKKMLILNILEILKKHTNEHKTLTQKEIGDILQREYGMTVDRKAIKRNLADLMEAGYPVRTGAEQTRNVPNKVTGETEENIACSDFYYEHLFTEGELRLLIDGILFSKGVSHRQGKDLIRKVESLTDDSFHYRTGHIHSLPDNQPENRQLFYVLETLDEAIGKRKKVEFTYNNYTTDKHMHPRTDETGAPKRQVINPYQMVASNGRFYLICNHENHDTLAYYRIDRITDINILKSSVKPLRDIPEAKNGLNLPQHLAEHLYMFPGKSERVTFRAKKYLLNDLIDWFGKDIEFSEETEDEVTASVRVNLNAMRMWALQYALHIKILEPETLLNQVKEDIRKVAGLYDE